MKADVNQKMILQLTDVKTYFHASASFFGKAKKIIKAVDGITLSIPKGCSYGVVGESGSGKSTLARTLCGIETLNSGSIQFNGERMPLKNKSRQGTPKIQYIFQDPFSSLNPKKTIGEALREPLKVHTDLSDESMDLQLKQMLTATGLPEDSLERYPHEFSGGQRQRITIARALLFEPELLICDEPVSALDVSVQAQVLNLLKDLQKTYQLTYLFISHDLGVVRYLCSHLAVMYLGRIVETGPTEDVFQSPRHPYTKALRAAYPIAHPKQREDHQVLLDGEIPSQGLVHEGCSFASRCLYADARCYQEAPQLSTDQAHGDTQHAVACFKWQELMAQEV